MITEERKKKIEKCLNFQRKNNAKATQRYRYINIAYRNQSHVC